MFGSCCCCLLRQLLLFNNSNFNWPAGLHLWSNSKSSTTTTTSSSTTTLTTSWLYIFTPWSIGLLVLLSLVLCWRNMTTEYSSPYKVGLINVGTTFAQSRLVWSEIAHGKLNFRGTVIPVRRFVAIATLAPHQSAQVKIQRGTRYVVSFSLLGD